MKRTNIYKTLNRLEIALDILDAEELALVDQLMELQRNSTDWQSYSNQWMSKVDQLYSKRGHSRRKIVRLPVWSIGQDLSSRLMVKFGLARSPDYRDRLDEIIRSKFPSRQAFSEATGISEDMLSHIIAHRKHLAVDTLSEALERIGYELRIEPVNSAN